MLVRAAEGSPWARLLLAPPSVLYRGAVGLRNSLFDSGAFHAERLPVPVVSVGNITAGGTGKTPLVAAIAKALAARGRKIAILTRGYGGSGRFLVLRDGSNAGPEEAGDEPILLARQVAGVPIVVGADRRRTGRIAVELGAEALLLDDGFQHRWLWRDLDIVVIDACDPFGHYRLLPSGRLREPLTALGRADVFVVTRSHPHDPLQTLCEVIRQYNPNAALFRAFHRPVSFVPLAGGEEVPLEALRGEACGAFCGIGNPEAFRSDLQLLGVRMVLFEPFRDHHAYNANELVRLSRLAREAGAGHLITTEKDAVRIAAVKGFSPTASGLPLLALRARCEIEQEFFALVERAALRGREG